MELTRQETRKRLEELAEEAYREFHSGLVPGKENILGVRMPKLREVAREINQGSWREWLSLNEGALQEEKPPVYYEEIMLRGLVIGGGRDASLEEFFSYVEEFVPCIDNWAICDCFCTSLKRTKKHKKEVWEFLQGYLESSQEYFLRFGVVMLLDYYIEADYLERLFVIFNRIDYDGYYVKMAVAWAISVCYIKYPKETGNYLKENKRLDDFTYNKAIQKICESYRVEKADKERLRQWKRKAGK